MEYKSTAICFSIKTLSLVFAIALLGDRAQSYVLPYSQLEHSSYPYTREEYGYGNNQPDSFRETGQESFVIVQDNTMMSANYNNGLEEIYLDAESSVHYEEPYDYGNVGALEGPQPTFEREDVDGEDLETVLEFGDYHLMPYNGRAPTGIEYDIDGLDYVAHDPRVLEDIAKSGAAYSGGYTDDEDYFAENHNDQQSDSWGFSV